MVDFINSICYNRIMKKKVPTETEKKNKRIRRTDEEIDNSFLMSPQRKMCWDLYATVSSATFGNAYKSALLAGYSNDTSAHIKQQEWFKQRLCRLEMLASAEKVLNKTLEMDTTDILGKEKADLLRIKTDVAKFVAKTQGKDEGYSERTEVTGKNGEAVEIKEIIFNAPKKRE